MRSLKTQGIIIKRRNIGEADRIITIFTRGNGKIKVKAPGVRRITSRRSAHVELLNLSNLALYYGSHSHIPILTEAQTIYNFSLAKTDLRKTGLAFYICELIDGLCPDNQENRKIFYLLKETLERLEKSSSEGKIVDEFEESLLTFLGFLPSSYLLDNRHRFIENILEKKLRTLEILPLLTGD